MNTGNNPVDVAKLSMNERLKLWKSQRNTAMVKASTERRKSGNGGSGEKNRLNERFNRVTSAFDEAVITKDDGQNANPNLQERRKIKKRTSGSFEGINRRNSGSLEGKTHPFSPLCGIEVPSPKDGRRLSSGSTGTGSGKKKRSSRRSFSESMGKNKIISPKTSTKKHTEAVELLESTKDEEIKRLEVLLAKANKAKEIAETENEQLTTQMNATWDEVKAQFFINGVQEQEIATLHGEITSNTLEQAEEAGDRRRKFKAEKRRLEAENTQLREMLEGMSEQLEQINDLASGRFQELEQEVSEKQDEIDALKSTIGAMKLREVQSRMQVASAEAKLKNATARRDSSSRGSTGSSGSATDEQGDEGDGYETE